MAQRAHNCGITSKRITITTTNKVEQMLGRLVTTGLYGKTVSEAAEILVCDSLRRELKSRRIEVLEEVTP